MILKLNVKGAEYTSLDFSWDTFSELCTTYLHPGYPPISINWVVEDSGAYELVARIEFESTDVYCTFIEHIAPLGIRYEEDTLCHISKK
jgi:hypothetical protein